MRWAMVSTVQCLNSRRMVRWISESAGRRGVETAAVRGWMGAEEEQQQGKPVSQQSGPARCHSAPARCHSRLTRLAVHRRGCLVGHQHAGLAQQGAAHAQQLALANTEVLACGEGAKGTGKAVGAVGAGGL